ncbi:RHS repeat-associated core domain-containing protein [Streptomyces bauhiniae]
MPLRLSASSIRARRSALTVLIAALLSVPAPLTPLASAAELPGRPDVPGVKPTRVTEITAPLAKTARAKVAKQKNADRKLVESARAERRRPWPKASTSSTALSGRRNGAVVSVTAASASKTSRRARALASGNVKITVLDQKAARRAGVTGILFAVAADSPGAAQLTVDYHTFASAVGGNWSTRLGLVTLPACALTTPQKPQCRTVTQEASENDVKAQKVTSQVSLAAASAASPTVMALTATASAASASGAGDFQATPLAASSTWQAGTSSGSFSWSYPITTPPAAAGPEPSLALSYDSGSVDGRTANTNNQGSLVGEGFDLTSSYIERKYGGCDDDGNSGKYDLCWKYDNASLVLNGKATELVHDDGDTKDVWHLKDDDASKVVRLTGADNNDSDGEYWKLTTGDGTAYTFGLNKLPGAGTERTNSAWTVPVFGDDDKEPGYDKGTQFKDRSLNQAWRWNLDLVEDVHGNASTYWYAAETNYYAKNGDKTALASYTRGGYPEEIRYGQRSDALFTSPASDKVTFTYKERCTTDCTSLTADTASNWPDVPFDSICDRTEAGCKGVGPAFFTRKRLAGITTSYWSRAAEPDDFALVDSYALEQNFIDGQDIGNSSDQVLALQSLSRTGKNGTDIKVPPIDFTYQLRPNRVAGGTQPGGGNILPLSRPRISSIVSETGAITSVTLSEPECVRGSNMPAAEDNNSLSCYPVIWPVNGGDPQLDWFQKYRVTAVTTNDPAAGNPGTQTAYEYSTPGWHYDDDPFTKEKERTWSVWRGYQKVTSYAGDLGTPRAKTVQLFMQGMNGDKRKDGTTRAAVVKGIDLDNVTSVTTDDLDVADETDYDYYAGQVRQQITYDGDTALSAVVNDHWAKQTASQQKSYANTKSYFVQTARTVTDTYLSAARKWRATAASNTYDDTYGMITQVQDEGDWAAAGDETCTRTWYARNDAKGLTALVSRTRIVAKPCARGDNELTLPASSDTRGDVLSDTATVYDNPSATGWSPDQTPTLGLPTWSGRAKSYPAATGSADRNPAAATGWQTQATTTYDTATAKLGRMLKSTDAKGRTTTTTYYPASAGPLTTEVVTQPKLSSNNQAHQSTTVYDPARGAVSYILDANAKRSESTYDALGRITATWLPNRSKSANDTPSAKYDYGLEHDKAPWASAATLKADGTTYETAYALYDAQLRPIQTQTASPLGGRILTDTRYDSRGLAYETFDDVYDNQNAPTSTYAQVPYGGATQTETEFDGARRPTSSTLLVDGVKKWSTTTSYTGDSTATTAVQGGTATRTITDALGRTTETRTYAGTQPSDTQYGSTSSTSYTKVHYDYTRDGKPSLITGPDTAKWSYDYDLFGRQVKQTDPDSGTTATSYTDLDQVDTTKDAENRVLLFGYDELGRRTGLWQTSRTDANQLSAWTYDTLLKGAPTASTRYENSKTGKAYTKQVTAYDTLGRPTGTSLTLPSDDPLVTSGAVTATTAFETTYRLDGRVGSTKEPAAGGLRSETVETRYNSQGLPTELSGASGYLLTTDYTALAQVGQLQLGPSPATGTKRVFVTNTYEKGTGRLTNAAVDDQTRGPVQDLTYAYDQAGNVTSITDATNLGTGTDNQCFSYDAYRRLTEAWTPKTPDCASSGRTASNISGPAPYWTSYTYTASGQRKTEKQNTGTTVTTTSCYDTARPHALIATTTTGNCTGLTPQYAYDNTGNTTRRVQKAGSSKAQTLAWSAEGKLARLTDDGTATATNYLYDADGQLLIRRDNAPSGETVLYLGATEVHLKTGKKWANRYYSAAGATIALRTNESGAEKLSFLAGDQHGTSSISITSDSAQALTKRYSTPFGNPRGQTIGVWPDDKGFLGKSADAGTGLTHIGAREYDPSAGQFISTDPILAPEQHQSLNGYSYAGNNPVTSSDPTGLFCDGCDVNNSGSVWKDNGPGCTTEGCYDHAGNQTSDWKGNKTRNTTSTTSTTTHSKSGPEKRRPKVAGVYIPTKAELVSRGMLFPGDTYDEALHKWAVGLCQGTSPSDSHYGSFCKVAAKAGALDSPENDPFGVDANIHCITGKGDCVEAVVTDILILVGAGWSRAVARGAAIEGATMEAATTGRTVRTLLKDCMCFRAGTKVLMSDRTARNIEKIKPGDRVLATDPETGETRSRKVTRLIITDKDKRFNKLSIVTTDGAKELTATNGHPFWSPSERRWIEAASLTPGMSLQVEGGHTAVVARNHAFTGRYRTYNLTVDGLHTYYVLAGNTPVLVHNSSCSTFGFKNSPTVPGVYTITMKDGKVYVGSSSTNIHSRLHAAFNSDKAAVKSAGYTTSDISNISVNDMSGHSWKAIREQEQSVMDQYGGVGGGTLLNRRNEVP